MLRRLRIDIRCILFNLMLTSQKNLFHKYQKVAPIRLKYTLNKGVKGIRSRKTYYETTTKTDHNEKSGEDFIQWSKDSNIDDSEYETVARSAMNVSRQLAVAHNVLILQPYIKWGFKKEYDVTPDDELMEAEALVKSLPNWQIAYSIKVPVESLDRKVLFGKGKLEELKLLVQKLRENSHGVNYHQPPVSCLFVSKSTLSFAQKMFLEEVFHLPVMDRYSIVIQILRLHATSAEARIQVAMAELPYIWAQAKDANLTKSSRVGYALTETQRDVIKTRERKLRQQLNVIRSQRKLLRKKRQENKLPIVAVVGYTNAGKTSLIKILTHEEKMEPKDQLFATLDVTAHAGQLPSNLQIIYIDTVGFMRNLPTGLMECFVSTLEDALLADLIIHVQDISHRNYIIQTQHVESTLKMLEQNVDLRDEASGEKLKLPPILRVANKIDLISNDQKFQNEHQHVENVSTKSSEVAPWDNCIKVSCKNATGLTELLQTIEDSIIKVTGRRKITIRVQQGSAEMTWLYKNSAVSNLAADPESSQYLLMEVIITEYIFQLFKRQFCKQ